MGIFRKEKTEGHALAKTLMMIAVSPDRSERFSKNLDLTKNEYNAFHVECMILSTFAISLTIQTELGRKESAHVLNLLHDMLKEHHKKAGSDVYNYIKNLMGESLIAYSDLMKKAKGSGEEAFRLIGSAFSVACNRENEKVFETAGKEIFNHALILSKEIIKEVKGYALDPIR